MYPIIVYPKWTQHYGHAVCKTAECFVGLIVSDIFHKLIHFFPGYLRGRGINVLEIMWALQTRFYLIFSRIFKLFNYVKFCSFKLIYFLPVLAIRFLWLKIKLWSRIRSFINLEYGFHPRKNVDSRNFSPFSIFRFFLLDQFFSGSGYDLFLRNTDLHRIFFLKLMDLRPYIVFVRQVYLKTRNDFPTKD